MNRIRPHLDDKLRPNQYGFREKGSTTEQILALRTIIEGKKDKNLSAVVTFIDFKKAFDTIHRGKMIKILKAYVIPDIIAHVIEDTYQGTKAKAITSDGDTVKPLHRGMGFEFSVSYVTRYRGLRVKPYHCVREWPSLSFTFFLLILFLFLAMCIFCKASMQLISLYWLSRFELLYEPGTVHELFMD